MTWHIRLRGTSDGVEGRVWESAGRLRIGRHSACEISVADISVCSYHATISPAIGGWTIRDLGSTTGSFLNGASIGSVDRFVRQYDVLRFGNFTLVADRLEGEYSGSPEEVHRSNERVALRWEVVYHGTAYPNLQLPKSENRFTGAGASPERAVQRALEQAVFFGWYVAGINPAKLLDAVTLQRGQVDQAEEASTGPWNIPLVGDAGGLFFVSVTLSGISAHKDSSWLRWNGSAIAHLAQQIVDDRAWDGLPILADALEDVGCDNHELLHYLRAGESAVEGTAYTILLQWLLS